MRPLSLHLENVRTFDTLAFAFPDGCCAIVGPNGAGKTTLISALDLALFAAKGELADWLSKDRPEATMTITLTFAHGINEYRVRRTYDGRGRGSSKFDFEEGDGGEAEDGRWLPSSDWRPLTRESASATQQELERIIGLNREVFRMSAYFGQKDRSLCDLQPREAKQVLFDTLGLDVWDGYRERARAELRAAEQGLAVVRAKIEQAEVELAEKRALAESLDLAKAREQEARASLEECGSQLVKARERLSKLREAAGLREAAERARGAAERSHASLLDRIASLEEQIRETEGRLAEREGLEELADGLPDLLRERDTLAEQKQGYAERERLIAQGRAQADAALKAQQKILDLRDREQRISSGVGQETCDRCGQVLQDESARKAAESLVSEAEGFDLQAKDALALSQSLSERIAELPASAPDRERLARVNDLIQQGRNAQQRLAALAEVEASRARAAEELQQVRAELPERARAARTASDALAALGPHDPGELASARYQYLKFENDEMSLRADLGAIQMEIARLDERLQRLDRIMGEFVANSVERDRLEGEVELLSHLERACGPNGVPALILETSVIPQLEAEWNRLLRLLPTDSGDLFEVELHTQRERKTGGAVDALDVVVYANGHARPYSTYSGGEQMRISIAQRRALSNLLAHRRGADCPLMILDEPNSLDDAGMAALAQVLEDLAAAEGLTILVVSHDPALRDAFEQSVTVSKADGRSRVETTDGAVSIHAVVGEVM